MVSDSLFFFFKKRKYSLKPQRIKPELEVFEYKKSAPETHFANHSLTMCLILNLSGN